MIEVRWHGRGGQGCFTVARLLGTAAAVFENKYSLAFPSFGPERRGAPVLGFTRIDEQKIRDRSEVEECDYVVVLDSTMVGDKAVTVGLKDTTTLVLNSTNSQDYEHLSRYNIVAIDATSLALDILGRPITNTAMLGALIAVSGIVDLESAINAVKKEMPKAISAKNVTVLQESFETAKGAMSRA